MATIILAVTAAGATYAAISPVVSPTTSDVVVQRHSSLDLTLAGGKNNRTTVLSVSLPAGGWVLSADPTVVSFFAQDVARCGLYADGNELNEHSTQLGRIASVPVATAFIARSTFAVSLQCWHDTTLTQEIYIDHGVSLWAHKAESLSKIIVN